MRAAPVETAQERRFVTARGRHVRLRRVKGLPGGPHVEITEEDPRHRAVLPGGRFVARADVKGLLNDIRGEQRLFLPGEVVALLGADGIRDLRAFLLLQPEAESSLDEG